MTIEQLVSAIRSLPVAERLRVIERVAHDVANDVAREAPETAPDLGVDVRLIERRGFLVAHSESRTSLPEASFDHRQDREMHAERLWSRS